MAQNRGRLERTRCRQRTPVLDFGGQSSIAGVQSQSMYRGDAVGLDNGLCQYQGRHSKERTGRSRPLEQRSDGQRGQPGRQQASGGPGTTKVFEEIRNRAGGLKGLEAQGKQRVEGKRKYRHVPPAPEFSAFTEQPGESACLLKASG